MWRIEGICVSVTSRNRSCLQRARLLPNQTYRRLLYGLGRAILAASFRFSVLLLLAPQRQRMRISPATIRCGLTVGVRSRLRFMTLVPPRGLGYHHERHNRESNHDATPTQDTIRDR
jgi:hypothetical protein